MYNNDARLSIKLEKTIPKFVKPCSNERGSRQRCNNRGRRALRLQCANYETQMMKEADKMEKIQKMEEKIHFKGGKYKNCTFNFNFS